MPKKKIQKKKSKNVKVAKKTRPPIVTVMGHVDHGKTTLLDAIRETNEVAKEAGGITQGIGAYQVSVKTKQGEKKITFIDTPGHEAFSAMRSRGAKVTDLVVLVVAADDGVKPQTVEAIKHSQNAGVPILVAINKIDLPAANPEKVKKQLVKENVVVEDLGGDVVSVLVSAKKKKGLDELLEMILLVAEMLEWEVKKETPFSGVVIESHLDSKKGPLASVIVKEGEVKVGDRVVSGEIQGKVKAMFDEWGRSVRKASASTPVEMIGFESPPLLGETIKKLSKKDVRRKKKEKKEGKEEIERPKNLEELFETLQEEKSGLKIVLKADNQGSLEAASTSLQALNSDEAGLEIVHAGVGEVSKSDILLAKTSQAIVISYRIKIPQSIIKMAFEEKVLVRNYDLIYKLIDEIEEALWGEVSDKIEEEILGLLEVIALFESSQGKVIAGGKVLEGRVVVGDLAFVLRKDEKVAEGKVSSLKHVKKDMKKVDKGMECGLTLDPDFNFQLGDKIEIHRQKQN